MKGFTKLALDIVMGAVIPILILNNLTRPLGAPLAYVIAALVPVAYVLADTFFISRRFNVITSYVALTAIMNGALAFWFVDGALFALKDTAALLVSFAAFSGSLLVGRPLARYFLIQALNPGTPAREAKLRKLLDAPGVRRAAIIATGLIVAESAVAAAFNFWLNLNTVTAPFGVEAFNQQVAQVNAITRLALPVASVAAFGIGFALVFRELYRVLPAGAESGSQDELWALIDVS
jgi:hypothetical protein